MLIYDHCVPSQDPWNSKMVLECIEEHMWNVHIGIVDSFLYIKLALGYVIVGLKVYIRGSWKETTST